MTEPVPSTLLRRALVLDAAVSAASALVLALGAGALAGPLGLPGALLHLVGLALLPFAALVAWTAAQPRPPGKVVRAIVALNAAWVAASLALLISGWVAPTALGHAVVIGQALVVGLFAQQQHVGLRRAHGEIA